MFRQTQINSAIWNKYCIYDIYDSITLGKDWYIYYALYKLLAPHYSLKILYICHVYTSLTAHPVHISHKKTHHSESWVAVSVCFNKLHRQCIPRNVHFKSKEKKKWNKCKMKGLSKQVGVNFLVILTLLEAISLTECLVCSVSSWSRHQSSSSRVSVASFW